MKRDLFQNLRQRPFRTPLEMRSRLAGVHDEPWDIEGPWLGIRRYGMFGESTAAPIGQFSQRHAIAGAAAQIENPGPWFFWFAHLPLEQSGEIGGMKGIPQLIAAAPETDIV
jgi:hypothetical protein